MLRKLFNINLPFLNYGPQSDGTEFTAARMCSRGILDHTLSKDLLRDSTLVSALAQAFVSKMDHIEKSMEFKSGLEGAVLC